jgi:hypothetical protein
VSECERATQRGPCYIAPGHAAVSGCWAGALSLCLKGYPLRGSGAPPRCLPTRQAEAAAFADRLQAAAEIEAEEVSSPPTYRLRASVPYRTVPYALVRAVSLRTDSTVVALRCWWQTAARAEALAQADSRRQQQQQGEATAVEVRRMQELRRYERERATAQAQHEEELILAGVRPAPPGHALGSCDALQARRRH